MINTNMHFGDAKLWQSSKKVALNTITLNEETFFKIENYDQMDPFFMTIVSDTDFWMFVSSTGGITAGRQNSDNALFPYYTDDKIHDSCETTGAHTMIILEVADKQFLWKPFMRHIDGVYNISRNLYKNATGNKIIFEEDNHTLQMAFRYTWTTSQRYGIVKTSELTCHRKDNTSVRVLDGIRNVLPYGINSLIQSTKSTLADGYKRSELVEASGLGIFTLSSIISDKAEPSESLKATTVWSMGLDHPKYLLCDKQVASFAYGNALQTESDIKGRRGAFYVSDTFKLAPGEKKTWVIVSELNQSAAQVEALIAEISTGTVLFEALKRDILRGNEGLIQLVHAADGMQLTENSNACNRHYSNTLFNIMRGGIYAEGYTLETEDVKAFVQSWNSAVYEKYSSILNGFDKHKDYHELMALASVLGDANFERLLLEYLPLTYSRRHGDPSRPWNKFNIEVIDKAGHKVLNYEGNWRDIFQNWEALSISYPSYIESIIAKFVNASSADGYNPYRITKNGIDWETLDPHDPWSNIGYWGDHQIIYLLKLMELSKQYHSDKLAAFLEKEIFVYANIPYRLKGFEALVKDPRNSIDFDDACEALVQQRVKALGADGKLIFCGDEPYRVNLMEKLLVAALSKISNFVPEGGIWMNTQRPEWNDANNALVGNGISMVTLYYLHRFLGFMESMLTDSSKVDSSKAYTISSEVIAFFEQTLDVLKETAGYLEAPISDVNRYSMVSALGKIGESYRNRIYAAGFSNAKGQISEKSLLEFLSFAKQHLKDSIVKNRRPDGLYHAYNLITFSGETCSIEPLYEMLEGQVAVLSSKALDTPEVLNVLKALRESNLYREDQNSYMLYPNRELPRFLEKNRLTEDQVLRHVVLKAEIEKGQCRIIERDIHGAYHFNGQFRNADEVRDALVAVGEYTEKEIDSVCVLFSELFNHHAFTGRSGTFYKYEGLGCIYWHMVSKLVLSTLECFRDAVAHEGNGSQAQQLADYFHEIKRGIGADKTPEAYGAFPTDAYSHTPGFAGVQQPGMTGQVKEDILSRFGELGVTVEEGEITFEPLLLSKGEFLTSSRDWQLPNELITIEAGQLGFTLAAVPVIYTLNYEKGIFVHFKNGDTFKFENTNRLSREISERVFMRSGDISRIVVNINSSRLKQ